MRKKAKKKAQQKKDDFLGKSILLVLLTLSATQLNSNAIVKTINIHIGGISVYNICFISINASLSDWATKISNLNIEKTWYDYLWFKFELDLLNTFFCDAGYTENVWLISSFATQKFCKFWTFISPWILQTKSWKFQRLLSVTSSLNI